MKKKIFLAVDTDQVDKAMAMIKPLHHELAGIKLGLEFFTANGRDGVTAVMKEFSNLAIFLDLKFHDIPNTVKGAMATILPLAPDFITVHAGGGAAMVAAAKQAIIDSKQSTKLLAVTMLTSLDDSDLQKLSIEKKSPDYILSLATMAKTAGADGVICSGGEAAMLRQDLGNDFILICPGIRLDDEKNTADQKRTMTPTAAISAGANFLVMGRSITANPEPLAALQQINSSLDS